MRMTQDLNSFGEIIAHVQCSVDEKIYIYIPCLMIANHNLVKKSFGPMIADHDLVKKRLTIMDAEVSTHTFLTMSMIIEESVRFVSVNQFFLAIILMWFYH
jgi:hypothetical protein